jgi:HK97 family phage major capsid protein
MEMNTALGHQYGRKSRSHYDDSDSHAEGLSNLLREYQRVSDEIKQFAAGAKSRIDEHGTKQLELQARLSEVEQKLLRVGRGGGTAHSSDDSPYASFVSKPDLLRPLIQQPGKASLTTKASVRSLAKAIVSLQPGDSPATGFPTPAGRLPDIYGLPAPNTRLLEVLPSVPFASNSLEYPSLDPSYSAAADYQLVEGDAKPESHPEFDLSTTPIVTIAHFVRASKQVLEDAPILQVWLERLMRYGVLGRVVHQLINGSGINKRLTGLLTVATPAVVSSPYAVDAIGEAAVALEVAGWQPSLVILHPEDAFAIVSERTSTGEYVAGGWAAQNRQAFWNLQRVTTPSMPAGQAIVMDANAVLILDREQPTVLVSTQDADNFTRNLVTLLGEVRLGMAILVPQAIARVTLPTASG